MNENENENKNKIVKDANIKEEPKEIKSLNWLDKNKFKEILTIIDSNKFGHKNKIGDFKYIDIKDLVNNIKDNTVSEIDAKKRLKNSEIKHKRLIHGQKELLNLFNNLSDIILSDKTLMSSKDETLKAEKESENENENDNEDYENEDEDDYYDYENEDNKTIDQNEIITEINDYFDKIIDKSKSFEDQIKSFKKVKNLDDYYCGRDFDDKELKYKYFKIKLAHLSNEIDEKLFEQIFGHTLIKLADKLINTTNKKENQIIVKNI